MALIDRSNEPKLNDIVLFQFPHREISVGKIVVMTDRGGLYVAVMAGHVDSGIQRQMITRNNLMTMEEAMSMVKGGQEKIVEGITEMEEYYVETAGAASKEDDETGMD